MIVQGLARCSGSRNARPGEYVHRGVLRRLLMVLLEPLAFSTPP
jgi:hypothetical protein